MSAIYQVVDLFAGPGGLAEGFSAYSDDKDHQPFFVTLSVEKEPAAHRTLQLRAFLRQFDEFPEEYYEALNSAAPLPDWSELYQGEWETAVEEALLLELGTPEAAEIIDNRIEELLELKVPTVLIGGPPCQAYSLVGRARNQGTDGYVAEKDQRHFLYREYIRILKELRPVAFVMENVKGMLSSSMDGKRIFEKVLEDLRAAGGEPGSYELFALALDSEGRTVLRRTMIHQDFIVECEDFGVPQARHRVIIVGLRRDVAVLIGASSQTAGGTPNQSATVRDVISGFPPLRSGLSVADLDLQWRDVVIGQMDNVVAALEADTSVDEDLLEEAKAQRDRFATEETTLPGSSTDLAPLSDKCSPRLASWLSDERLEVTLNHANRKHMADDFSRYFFCAVFTSVRGRSPKSREFPKALAPKHANWNLGSFADRFRAQGWDEPATTITSHISKDGHYFIHPDPQQCRTLTVREAARLQTFPDNYLFLGNRTEQYVQVGNAVPPFLAKQIAETLARALASTKS
jgi:DNA (cytosine-5)-methyltransferase 1